MVYEIDRESSVPAYRQVAAVLRGQIERGEYAPGQRLPSITTLVQTYGVAQLTARKALRVLVTEGLAEVSPGMGTYVMKERGLRGNPRALTAAALCHAVTCHGKPLLGLPGHRPLPCPG